MTEFESLQKCHKVNTSEINNTTQSANYQGNGRISTRLKFISRGNEFYPTLIYNATHLATMAPKVLSNSRLHEIKGEGLISFTLFLHVC